MNLVLQIILSKYLVTVHVSPLTQKPVVPLTAKEDRTTIQLLPKSKWLAVEWEIKRSNLLTISKWSHSLWNYSTNECNQYNCDLKIQVFLDVTLYQLVNIYWHFEGCSATWKSLNYLPVHMAEHPWRFDESSTPLLWELADLWSVLETIYNKNESNYHREPYFISI